MKYHSHRQLLSALMNLEKKYPTAAKTFNLGKSNLGYNITGIRLTSGITNQQRTSERAKMRPMVKLIGNMYGNEPTGRELLINFAKYILMANLLGSTDLYILPTMNPDGFERAVEGRCLGASMKLAKI